MEKKPAQFSTNYLFNQIILIDGFIVHMHTHTFQNFSIVVNKRVSKSLLWKKHHQRWRVLYLKYGVCTTGLKTSLPAESRKMLTTWLTFLVIKFTPTTWDHQKQIEIMLQKTKATHQKKEAQFVDRNPDVRRPVSRHLTEANRVCFVTTVTVHACEAYYMDSLHAHDHYNDMKAASGIRAVEISRQ